MQVWVFPGLRKGSYHWFFFDGTFFTEIKKLRFLNFSQLLHIVTKSAIEKKPMVRSLLYGGKPRK